MSDVMKAKEHAAGVVRELARQAAEIALNAIDVPADHRTPEHWQAQALRMEVEMRIHEATIDAIREVYRG